MNVSIIVVSFNNVGATHKCVTSLLHLLNESRELIVVDNHSADGSKEYVKSLNTLGPRIQGVVLDDNLGPGRARNIGVSRASGEKILFLDNDTYAKDGADFVQTLDSSMDNLEAHIVGMCAVTTFDCRSYFHIHQNDLKKPLRTMGVTSYCMMTTKKIFDNIAGFDPIFGLFADEDIDFCFRAIFAGYKIFAVNSIPLIHTEHGSGFATSPKYVTAISRNHKILEERYLNKLKSHDLDIYKKELLDAQTLGRFDVKLTNIIGDYAFFDSHSNVSSLSLEKNSL